ncbi:MAG: hypothetical protein FWG10_10050 [Eubacteriaceae bacterium]|nr:hypothetical protein [Eubacteriaceae bacterium]
MPGFLQKLFDLLLRLKPDNQSAPQPGQAPKLVTVSGQKEDSQETIIGGGAQKKLVLWGVDGANNPSFIFFYGTLQTGVFDRLGRKAVYTDYQVFRGNGGHFPSFESVTIFQPWRSNKKMMFYKRDLRMESSFSYQPPSSLAISGFSQLDKPLVLPANDMPYKECAQAVASLGIKTDGFHLANDPQQVLGLPTNLSEYADQLVVLFSNPGIYMRKKALAGLIKSSPPKELYEYLLRVGSSELVAGLFLELATQNNGILAQEARSFILSAHTWSSDNYIAGIKRCAGLYVDSFSPNAKEGRIELLRAHLPELELQLTSKNGKPFGQENQPGSLQLRRFAMSGALSEYYYHYDRAKNQSVRMRRQNQYEVNYYCDGLNVNINRLKETIQQAELFSFADAIGKIAYYLDSPRLAYHFAGTGKKKSLNYFTRYTKRILNTWAVEDGDKYIEAMSVLLPSYTSEDYLCKYAGNFQFNVFIKQYLYNSCQWEVPAEWYARGQWLRDDQLAKLEGRFEYMPELWDGHLDAAIKIASTAKIDVIAKAFYYIISDSKNKEWISRNLSSAQLAGLCAARYKPLADTYMGILKEKIACDGEFDILLMVMLANHEDGNMQLLALEYAKRIPDLSKHELLNAIGELIELKDQLPQEFPAMLEELLDSSLEKLSNLTMAEKIGLFQKAADALNTHLPPCLESLLAQIVFGQSIDGLAAILKASGFTTAKLLKQPYAALLDGAQRSVIPADSAIVSILETGTSKMLNFLVEIATVEAGSLRSRLPTILLMLECEVEALFLLAKDAFYSLEGNSWHKMLSMAIDSPIPKAASFGLDVVEENYGQNGKPIPQEVVVQMLEHPSLMVKKYMTGKISQLVENPEDCDPQLFSYYLKTILFLPNKAAQEKTRVYDALPMFVKHHGDYKCFVEETMLELGASNVIAESERSLVALARIRMEENANWK